MTIYTVGHSNRTIEEFVELLTTHGIKRILDIRAIPYSGYNPQFNRESITAPLQRVGIAYVHNEVLAGPPPDRETMARATRCSDRSVNYGRHVESELFERALTNLLSSDFFTLPTALMCGEKRPDHCHRRVTADAITSAGHNILHLIDTGQPEQHQPSLF